MNNETLQQLSSNIDDSFFLIGAALLLIEMTKGIFDGSLKWRGAADMFASLSTQIPFLLIETFILSSAYGIYYVIQDSFVLWQIGISTTSILLVIIVADFLYYWEHRLAHETRILWVQHAVHHSSRYMNITTAFRFGPFEGAWSIIVMLPMAFIGFPPELIIFGSLAVLAYQTWLHTELIGKLGLLEWFMNTPSHHRVHHGCDEKYMDKNYGGIFIIWDRLFGSFQQEEETPNYGLAHDFKSVNPFLVWFSEWPSFLKDVLNSKTTDEMWKRIFNPPAWQPTDTKSTKK